MRSKKRGKIASILLALTIVVSMCAGFITNENTVQAASTGVSYTTHVQKKGWLSYVSNGITSGTSGLGLRLEAFKLKLTNANYPGNIEYRAYCQTYAWTNWAKNDGLAGTSGQGKRMEAVQIKLTGEIANHYDVYYRVHSQTYGWLGWAKNGETAGTADYAKRLEAIQIKLVAKGASAPGSTARHYLHPMIKYRTHVQSFGWQNYVMDGAMSGTSGKAKRLEGINISLTNQEYAGSVSYQTHVQTYGWQSWKSNGAMSGTSGEAKRLEAIRIKLTGEMSKKYDIYYRVHAQKFGWMGWAKNGASAGTEGYGYRLEAIEIRLVDKGAAAPGTTLNAFRVKSSKPTPTPVPTPTPTPSTISVTGVKLDRTSDTLSEGDVTYLSATVSPSNATNKDVTWKSSNPSVATVSQKGMVTAISGGTTEISVETKDKGYRAVCKITVPQKYIAVQSVRLNQSEITVEQGKTKSLSAIINPSNATDKSLEWYTEDYTIATISNSGVVTGKKPGSTSVYVRTSSGKKAYCKVTVISENKEISTVDELLSIDGKDGTYILVKDIDMSTCNKTIASFKGTLDGKGHSITNQKQTLINENHGTVKNINFKNVAINENGECSAVAKKNRMATYNNKTTGTIENCTVTGTITSKSSDSDELMAAGIANINEGVIKDCKNYAVITGNEYYTASNGTKQLQKNGYLCGIANKNNYGTILNCSNYGKVGIENAQGIQNASGIVGDITYVGSEVTGCSNTGAIFAGGKGSGIAITNFNQVTLSKCHNEGQIVSQGTAAGIVLVNAGTVENCYNTGSLTTSKRPQTGATVFYVNGKQIALYTAGLVLNNEKNAVVTNCYNTGIAEVDVCGTNNGTISNVRYLTSSAKYVIAENSENSKNINPLSKNQFTQLAQFSTFDFTNVWKMGTNGPQLR